MYFKRRPSIAFLLVFLFLLGSVVIYAGQIPKKFNFEKKDALDEWEEKIFKGRVLYSVKVDKNDGYLSAYSDNTASGILFKIGFDPKEEPMISWKWKVLHFPGKKQYASDSTEWIEQDDYAARFYVIFPKLAFNHTKALEYVWDIRLPVETIKSSPYSENIKIIVIESGNKFFKKWIHEERNIYDDFVKAFGHEPPKVGAIAIMTDTDNTRSTAEANYDEIKVGYKNETE